jgi:hypothetical protein
MVNPQYELCREVLVKLETAGVLRHLVLVGSWCLLVYQKYFAQTGALRTLRTRDLDFLVPIPLRIPLAVDVPDLLADIGFVPGHRGEEGYMILQHPELLVEFLVPERGRGYAGAYPLRQLGMNAQPLRFMDLALMKPMPGELFKMVVRVPHPACFALHKLIVSARRKDVAKKQRDIESAIEILELLRKQDAYSDVVEVLRSLPQTWQRTIRKQAAPYDLSP